MPGTTQEYLALIQTWRPDSLLPPATHWQDGTPITDEEACDLVALLRYARQRARRKDFAISQRRAMKLLRSLLNDIQRRQLRESKSFRVATPGGNTYRLWPRTAHVERVRLHRSRYFVVDCYCLHDDDDDDKMPPADVTIAHLLLLLADEPAFEAEANANTRRDQLWNGEYHRRLREARRNTA